VRIVSLLPSATEMVVALGRGGELVGRSEECDWPPSLRGLPAVMRPRAWDSERPSAEIDDRVRATRGAGESLYVLDVAMLANLRPDLILTQDLCGVCSVTEAEVERACSSAGVAPKIVSLTPRSLSEVGENIVSVGRAIDAIRTARVLARPFVTPRVRPSSDAPGVAVVEWLDPPILAGLWTPEMVVRAGGTPIGPRPGEVGHRTTWPAIARRRPDLVVVSPCSFSVTRTARELSRSRIGDTLLDLGARRGVWLADEAYFSRPGPRLADGIALLRNLLGSEPPEGPMAIQRWDPPRSLQGEVA
jgi:iron complex transport system substrate-binding protein